MSIPAVSDYGDTATLLAPWHPIEDVHQRGPGTVMVRMSPLIEPGPLARAQLDEPETVTETVLDMQLIVDYTLALARRTATRIRAGQIDYSEAMKKANGEKGIGEKHPKNSNF